MNRGKRGEPRGRGSSIELEEFARNSWRIVTITTSSSDSSKVLFFLTCQKMSVFWSKFVVILVWQGYNLSKFCTFWLSRSIFFNFKAKICLFGVLFAVQVDIFQFFGQNLSSFWFCNDIICLNFDFLAFQINFF